MAVTPDTSLPATLAWNPSEPRTTCIALMKTITITVFSCT